MSGIWKKEQDTSFDKLKDMTTNAPILSYYDPKKPLTLNVGASSKGVGAVLLQNDKPIAYASNTNSNSAKICSNRGRDFGYCFWMPKVPPLCKRYKPGKSMYVSDTLSRMYLQETLEKLVPDIESNEIQLNAHLRISPEKYEQFKKQTEIDEIMQRSKITTENGWPQIKRTTRRSETVLAVIYKWNNMN
ncbi:unnamed protein product [Mytilus coruscus]|uniref:Reverse transcriptase/retrotransposon-derived protein RNase H-like domain-containing protein n=1 Tax=Mytilus coruscus TaxID=42192 RepID=A0A6J8BHG0_MYTCO|nr:unnamed protein product [Mytilus coruscus]